jgi:hypothetical protein
MQALFIAWYNFGRKHEALKGNTPAMTSKLTDHVANERPHNPTADYHFRWMFKAHHNATDNT